MKVFKHFCITAAFFASSNVAFADDHTDCDAAIGTYLMTKLIENGGKAAPEARAILALNPKGQAIFTDAAQGGGADYQPFSDAFGSWICKPSTAGNLDLKIVLLDFTYATEAMPDQVIARIDTSASLPSGEAALVGSTVVSFVDIDGDPLDVDQLERIFDYTFAAQKILAKFD